MLEDETVTQTGHQELRLNGRWSRPRFSFRSGLRTEQGEKYMSVILGRLTPEEAVPLVSRGDAAGSADAVRYASVRDLRAAGFRVRSRASKTIPGHLAVTCDGVWDGPVAARFDACFNQISKGPMR